MLKTYTRTHVPTGDTYDGEFIPAHDAVFQNPDWYPQRVLNAAMQACIDKWNRQQPTEWSYTLNK